MRRLSLVLFGCLVLPLALSGCSSIKSVFTAQKTVPNEFDVVQNAPLAIPPDFNLRPPKPGAGPTQAVSSTSQAKEAIFRAGDQQAELPAAADQRSAGEDQILRNAGAGKAEGDIRDVVNKEASEDRPLNKGFVDRLIFWRSDAKEQNKELLDPAQEAARLSDKSGTSATIASQFSSPPTIDRKTDSGSFFGRLF